MNRMKMKTEILPAEGEAIAKAADLLRRGELVALPTETVYGLAADASGPGLDRLIAATGAELDASGAAPPAFSWHASDAAALIERLETPSAVARRLLGAFLPGPVSFLLEQPGELLAAWRDELGVPEGVIDNGTSVSVRVPRHTAARELIEAAGGRLAEVEGLRPTRVVELRRPDLVAGLSLTRAEGVGRADAEVDVVHRLERVDEILGRDRRSVAQQPLHEQARDDVALEAHEARAQVRVGRT